MLRWHKAVNAMCLGPLWCGTNDQLPCGTGVLRCVVAVLPCGMLVLRWTCQGLPRGMLVGPTCQVSIVVGPTWLRWTNEVLTRGTDTPRWPNKVLTRGILSLSLSLFSDYVSVCLRSPVWTQMSLCPQVAPRWTLDWIWALDLSFFICFIFSEFILIAPLIQKSWNFHQKSLNSWWSPL
jgi:hypothetical protein